MVMMTREDVAAHKARIERDKQLAKSYAGGTVDGQYMLFVKLIVGCYAPDLEDADMQVVRTAVSQ